MRIQVEEWQQFIPGVCMYKEMKTLFSTGEIIFDVENDDIHIYDQEEQDSWEVIIVLPGVEVIPEQTFAALKKIKTVIMSDTVRIIEDCAFFGCDKLKFVKLLRNLEFIGHTAFLGCSPLSSIFIPPSCRQVGDEAFGGCKELMIVHVPRQTQLGKKVITNTALIRVSAFELNEFGNYDTNVNVDVNEWIKNINRDDDQFALHRACSSYNLNPFTQVVYETVKRQGVIAFKKKNQIGITPLEYLEANPFADIDQNAVMQRYVSEKMGDVYYCSL